MAMRALDAPHGVVERAAQLALERLEGEHAIRVAELIRRYWERVAPDDLLARDPADLFGAAMAHWQTARPKAARPGAERPPVQPRSRGRRLGEPPHRGGGGVRRPAVPRRLRDDGAAAPRVGHPPRGAPGARRRADGRRRAGRSGRRHPGVVDPPGGRSPGQPGERARRPPGPPGRARRRPVRGRRLAGHAVPGRRSGRASWAVRPLRCRPRSGWRPRSCSTGWWTTTSPSSATGSTSWSPTPRVGRCCAGVPGSGLGVLRDDKRPPTSRLVADLPELVRARLHEPTLLLVTKANARSTVHRPDYLEYVGVKVDRRQRQGDRRTSLRRPLHRPRLPGQRRRHPVPAAQDRRRHRAVGSRSGQPRRPRAVEHPGDVPARRPVPDLRRRAVRDRHRHREPPGAQAGAPVRPAGPLRALRLVPGVRAEGPLQRSGRRQDGAGAAAGLRRDQLRAHHADLRERAGPRPLPGLDAAGRAGLRRRSPRWSAASPASVAGGSTTCATRSSWRRASTKACSSLARFGEAFPASYREQYGPKAAVMDIRRLAALDDEGFTTALYRPVEAAPSELRLKLYTEGQAVSLSAVLPLLEHLGMQVTDERPYELRLADGSHRWLYDFGLRAPASAALDSDEARDELRATFAGLWRGEIEGDGFNRLVLLAGLSGRQVTVLRAYAKYQRQAGTTFSQRYIENTLAAHPAIARKLMELFAAALRPRTGRSLGRGGARPGRRAPPRPRRGGQPRRGPHPARVPEPHRGDAADQRLPARSRRAPSAVAQLQARPGQGARPAAAAADVRDLGVLAARSRACTCAAGASPAAACAGRTAWRTSAPRCSAS